MLLSETSQGLLAEAYGEIWDFQTYLDYQDLENIMKTFDVADETIKGCLKWYFF